MTTTIYTIGYGGVLISDFVGTLWKTGVTLVVDCRSKPWSRQRNFTKEKLERWLHEAGIEYMWEPRLGGKEGKRPEGWHEALEDVIQRANEGKIIACMCMEYLPTDCHRGKWLAPDLEARGIRVEHLFAPQNKPRPDATRNTM